MSTIEGTVIGTRKMPSIVEITKSVGGTLKLDDLTGVEDYAFWSLKMRNYLESQALWPYVSGQIKRPEITITPNSEGSRIITEDEGDSPVRSDSAPVTGGSATVTGGGITVTSEMLSDWVTRDDLARTAITNKLGINPSKYIRWSWSSKEIWDALDKLYSAATKYTSLEIERGIKDFYVHPEKDLSEQLAQLIGLYKDLENLGRVVDDTEITRNILLSLDSKIWGTWIKNFQSSHTDVDRYPSSHEMTVILRNDQQTHEIIDRKAKNISLLAKAKKGGKGADRKAGVKCYNCGKKGHFANECRSKKKDKSEHKKSETKAKDSESDKTSQNDSQPKQKTFANMTWTNPNTGGSDSSGSKSNRVW